MDGPDLWVENFMPEEWKQTALQDGTVPTGTAQVRAFDQAVYGIAVYDGSGVGRRTVHYIGCQMRSPHCQMECKPASGKAPARDSALQIRLILPMYTPPEGHWDDMSMVGLDQSFDDGTIIPCDQWLPGRQPYNI